MKDYTESVNIENAAIPAEEENNLADTQLVQEHHTHKHHHSHGAHSSRRRRHSRRKSKFSLFMAKNKSILLNIFFCAVALALLFVMARDNHNLRHNDAENSSPIEITNSLVAVETSVYSKEVPLVTDAINTYMASKTPEKALEVYKAFDGSKGHLNYGLAWEFNYQVTGLPNGLEVSAITLDLSEDELYKTAKTYELNIKDYKFSVYNLKPATKYYYRLNLTLSDGTYSGAVGQFKTAASPRILKIDGAVNVRDIGGYKTLDSKKIKHGLIYRGSEIDGKVEKAYCLTEKGKDQMLNDLKIRFDLDLRAASLGEDGVDALGKNVKHTYFSAANYSNIFLKENSPVIRNIFADLADKNNYPMYIHCTYGRDRTGTVCYLLEALLGVSDEDLYKDYALSIFTDSFIETEKFETFIGDIAKLDGKTTKEKVENWLLSIGVTAEEISSIRNILLEG